MFFFVKTLVFAQKDTTYTIPNVVIETSKELTHLGSSSIFEIDSTLKNIHFNGTIGDLLTSDNTIFVKSYGTGSLNNSMLGLTDISIIPANFMNEIKIQAGGGSALWGNGAIGGVIHLNNTTDYSIKRKIAISVNYSSLQNLQSVFQSYFSIKKVNFTVNLFKNNNQNNIKYAAFL